MSRRAVAVPPPLIYPNPIPVEQVKPDPNLKRPPPHLLNSAPVPVGEVIPDPKLQDDGPPDLNYPLDDDNDPKPESRLRLYGSGSGNKPRRGTPKRSAAEASKESTPYTGFTSKSGERYLVRKDNEYIRFMGNNLGSGKTALVVEDKNDKTVAYKIFKTSDVLREELYTHQLAACIGVAPYIYGVNDNVVKMERIYMLTSFPSEDQQKQLVELVARMVTIGLVHNDLHLKNIGFLDDNSMVLIDFETTQVLKETISDTLFLQVVMAQLYALIDPCDSNNIQLNAKQCADSFIMRCIYAIRAHEKDDQIVATLLEIREEAAAKFNSSGCLDA